MGGLIGGGMHPLALRRKALQGGGGKAGGVEGGLRGGIEGGKRVFIGGLKGGVIGSVLACCWWKYEGGVLRGCIERVY